MQEPGSKTMKMGLQGMRNSKFEKFSGMWKTARKFLPHVFLRVYHHLMELRKSQYHCSNNRGNFQFREEPPVHRLTVKIPKVRTRTEHWQL